MRLIRLTIYVASAALLVVASPATTSAQDKSRSEGFFIGGSLEGNGVAFDDTESTESGPGFGLTFGYGFTPKLAIYGQLGGASIKSDDGDYGLGHFDIGTRVHFRAPAKTVVPFIQAGLSSRALQQDIGRDEIESTGFGFAVGGGINAHINPAVAFTAGVVWSFGNTGNFKVNGVDVDFDSVGMTTARVQVGLTWFVQSK